MTAVLNDLESQLISALEEHEFFELQPVVNNKHVYQSATQHIVESINTPANEITLGIRIDQNDPGTIQDLLRLVPVFCKVLDPTWESPTQWIQAGMNHFEYSQEFLKEDRQNYRFEFMPMPEIGYIMVKAYSKN